MFCILSWRYWEVCWCWAWSCFCTLLRRSKQWEEARGADRKERVSDCSWTLQCCPLQAAGLSPPWPTCLWHRGHTGDSQSFDITSPVCYKKLLHLCLVVTQSKCWTFLSDSSEESRLPTRISHAQCQTSGCLSLEGGGEDLALIATPIYYQALVLQR